MKKGLLALAAGLLFTAGSASAADYYLIGGFNGWSLKQANCKFTDAGNGEYTLDYNGTLTSGFKINDGTWSNNAANWGGSSNLVIGETYTLQVGGSSGNINMSGNIDNPHIVFNPTAGTLLITGQQVAAEYTYQVHGSFVPSWESKDMVEEDGVWTYTANLTTALSFGIKKCDKASGAQVDWIASAGSANATLNTAMPCAVNGTNWTLAETGDITFKFDPEAMTLTLEGEGGGPAARTIYLAGEFNSWNGADANYQFTKADDGSYTLSMDALTGSFKVVSDGAWLGTTIPVMSGEEYTLSDIGMANMTLSAASASDLTFTFYPETNILKVVYTGGEIDYSTWYVNVLGDFNSWLDNGVNPDENGVATLVGLEIGTSPFKVKIWNGTAEDWRSNGEAVPQNEWVSVLYNNDANMTIAGAEEGQGFDVSFNVVTGELKVVYNPEVSVASIAAANGEAVYFNLQGVRVANPENGLFIRVQNGKAVKVVK